MWAGEVLFLKLALLHHSLVMTVSQQQEKFFKEERRQFLAGDKTERDSQPDSRRILTSNGRKETSSPSTYLVPVFFHLHEIQFANIERFET